MRHRKGGFKLQRNPSARRALLRGLTTNVILRDRVVTTVTKAKAVKPVVEKMITLAKRDTLHTRRQAAAFLNTPGAVKKLFDNLGPRFAQRNGGYTRVVRLGPRKGDGAELALIELLGSELKKRTEERRKRREDRMKQQQEAEAAETGKEESPEK
jgi:large subunit ribosomal protein L17